MNIESVESSQVEIHHFLNPKLFKPLYLYTYVILTILIFFSQLDFLRNQIFRNVIKKLNQSQPLHGIELDSHQEFEIKKG